MKLIDYLEDASNKYARMQKRSWMPGLIALVRAVDKGDDVGILTARANAEGNKSIITKIEKIVRRFSTNKNFKFKKDHLFFVGDIQGKSSDEKKADVIREYQKALPRVKFKFYDDEEKNLITINKISGQSGVYDIKLFDANRLIEEPKKEINKIHLFDLDGTIINTPAKIKKITSSGTKEFSQEEFAHLTDLSLKEGESWSFKDFTDAEIIDKYMSTYKVFKK